MPHPLRVWVEPSVLRVLTGLRSPRSLLLWVEPSESVSDSRLGPVVKGSGDWLMACGGELGESQAANPQLVSVAGVGE